MRDLDKFTKALQVYFPSDTLNIVSITTKVYIECGKIFSATLDTSKERSIMIEDVSIKGFNALYEDYNKEIQDTEKYIVHAITSALIRSKKSLSIKRIYCKLCVFKNYIRDVYPRYANSEEGKKINSLKIEALMTAEAHQFKYIEILPYINKPMKVQDSIEYFPIWHLGKFNRNFNFIEIIENFNPYLHNIYQIMHVLDLYFDETDRKIMYSNLLSSIELSYSAIETIIDKVFDGVLTPMIFTHTKTLRKFNKYFADKYRIDKMNIWDTIARLENLDEEYIESHYLDLKPYFRDLFKNPNLSLQFLENHAMDIWVSGSYPMVLIFNKNINRDYLMKHKRRYKNAIIHRIDLLQHGDEYLFNKYRRYIKWDLLKEYYKGDESVSINDIINYGKKYLSQEDIDILRNIHNTYIRKMFVVK